MSDSLDVRGPIPLTRADLDVRLPLSLAFILCNLSPLVLGTRRALDRSSTRVRSFDDATAKELTSNPMGHRSVLCDVFSRTLRRSNHTAAHFLNRVTWSSRLWVVGLVALALIAMAPPTGSSDDEDLGPSAIAIVASRINGSLSSRSTNHIQQHEPNNLTTAPTEPPRRVRALEAKISWHAGHSTLKSFCLLRC